MKRMFIGVIGAIIGLLGCGMTSPVQAKFPERPVTIIVPWGAGGGSDNVARALAPSLEKALGQTVLIVNKPGSGGNIGTSFVAHSRPDGYTVGLINNSGVVHQLHYGGVDYSREDLEPLCIFLRAPLMLSCNSSLPYKNLKEFIAYCKDHPGEVSLGTSTTGGSQHIPMEVFFKKAGIKVNAVPFKGGGVQSAAACVGNHVQCVGGDPSEVAGHIKAGKLIPLAVAEETRLPMYPDVPTFKEQGIDLVDSVWRSFLVPKGVPADVKATLLQAFKTALQDPTYLETVKKFGLLPDFIGPEETLKIIERDNANVLPIIKELGLYMKNVKK